MFSMPRLVQKILSVKSKNRCPLNLLFRNIYEKRLTLPVRTHGAEQKRCISE